MENGKMIDMLDTALDLIRNFSAKTWSKGMNSTRVDNAEEAIVRAKRKFTKGRKLKAILGELKRAQRYTRGIKPQRKPDARKRLKALEDLDAARAELMNAVAPTHGPAIVVWVQDLYAWSDEQILEMLDSIESTLGKRGAIGFNVMPFGEMLEMDANEFAHGGDLSKLKDIFLDRLVWIAEEAIDRGLGVYGWGLPWPTIRRKKMYNFNWHGQVIEDGHWSGWAGPAVPAGKAVHSTIRRILPNKVILVDGVEPHAHGMEVGPPLNRYQLDILSVDPSCIQSCNSANESSSSLTIARPDVHMNPALGVHEFFPYGPTGGLRTTDGWGVGSSKIYEDGRGYAGLPGGSVKESTRWFVEEYIQAEAERREAFVVLHTTAWSVKNVTQARALEEGELGPERPMLFRADVQPFREAYEAMAKVEFVEAGDEVDISDAIVASRNAQDIARWPITASQAGVTFADRYIRQDHDGAWPLALRTSSSGKPIMIEGNVWVGAWINGKLHIGTYEFVAPNGAEGRNKSLGGDVPGEIGAHIKDGPLANWHPQNGERVIFFSSSIARGNDRSVEDQRGPVIETVWGKNA